MAKRKRAVKRKKTARKTPPPLPPITQEAVHRLEKLANDLDTASKEAAAVADIIRTDLADELSNHLVDSAAKKTE